MMLDNYQWSNEKGQTKKVGGKLELDTIITQNAKVDAMSQRLECLNVNSVSSNAPSLSCEICGSVDHLTVNCQIGTLFAQYASDQVNYVNKP